MDSISVCRLGRFEAPWVKDNWYYKRLVFRVNFFIRATLPFWSFMSDLAHSSSLEVWWILFWLPIEEWKNSVFNLRILMSSLLNSPFYSCVLGCQVFEQEWDWGWPWYDTNLAAFQMKITLFSPSVSLQIKGLTQGTVICNVKKNFQFGNLSRI